MSLTKKEIDELKPIISAVVKSVMGFSEPTLITAAINCLDNGFSKQKTAEQLKSIIDDSKATPFADKLFRSYDEYRSSRVVTKKRKDHGRQDDIFESSTQSTVKKKRFMEDPPEPGQPSPGQLTADKIKEMMMNAQKTIKERKIQLETVMPVQEELALSSMAEPPPPSFSQQQLIVTDAMEKAKRAAELQAKIKAQLSNAGLGMIPVKMPAIPDKSDQPSKPTPLILDDQGRTIDAKTGETIQLTQYMPTLKANIRAKKRDEFKAVIQSKPPEEITEAKYFDTRVKVKPSIRMKKNFTFHEEGKFQQLASRLRTKAQLEKLQGEIASVAKKTGIASAAKLATLQPKKEVDEDAVPSVEWWDAVILRNETYDSLDNPPPKGKEKFEGITHLIEHPTQLQPPGQSTSPAQIAVMLTKKERKKVRRQNRNETQKELTEKIRLGLIPAPEPKVRMANLMRVLGTEAVQDPTKVEAHVRAQMAKRVKAHEEANANRKLTKEQRTDKKIKKIKEDTSTGVHVSVYRVRELNNPAHKFKVETNAKQLFMTGIVVLHKDCNVVTVEGGPKQQKKFRRLMLHRIKWNEDKHGKIQEYDDSDEEGEERKGNSCALVWEGLVKQRAFGDIKFKMCPTPTFAREQFRRQETEHYWDLAYSGSVLEAAGEDL